MPLNLDHPRPAIYAAPVATRNNADATHRLIRRYLDRRNDEGARLWTDRKASLNRRTLPKPAAKPISVNDRSVSSISYFAFCTRLVAATSLGLAPAWRMKRRSRWGDPTPRAADRLATDSRSRKPSSIMRIPRATVVAVPIHAGDPGAVSGRQRRQGRNPARSAAAAVA
jgi:hypothetical protein